MAASSPQIQLQNHIKITDPRGGQFDAHIQVGKHRWVQVSASSRTGFSLKDALSWIHQVIWDTKTSQSKMISIQTEMRIQSASTGISITGIPIPVEHSSKCLLINHPECEKMFFFNSIILITKFINASCNQNSLFNRFYHSFWIITQKVATIKINQRLRFSWD